MNKTMVKLEGVSKSKGYSSTLYRNKTRKSSKLECTAFLAESLHKEVMEQDQSSGRSRKLRSLKRLHKGFTSILVTAMMASPLTAFAQDTNIYSNMMQPSSDNQELTPNLVMQWGLTISLMIVAIGVAISASLLVIAGIYKALRKGKEAEEWTTDIIKGLVQVLIAIPVVYSLFYLAQMVFKRLPVLEGLL